MDFAGRGQSSYRQLQTLGPVAESYLVKAGKRAAALIRADWRGRRRLRRALLQAQGAMLGVGAATVLFMPDDFFRGVVVGVCGSVALLGFPLDARAISGVQVRLMGAEAERFTASALEPLRRAGWFLEHDVVFERLNVDHVAFGPGVTAVFETKWTTQPMTSMMSHTESMQRWAHQAQGAADKIRLLARVPAPIPVLVLWGPQIEPLPAGHRIDQVRVVRGGDAEEWVPRLLRTAADEPLPEAAIERLQGYLDSSRRRQQRAGHRWLGRRTATRQPPGGKVAC